MKNKKVAILVFAVIIVSVVLVVALANQKDNAQFPTSRDVAASDWFYDDVNYVRKNGLMNGTSENEFAPYDNTDRAMLVTVLWRLEGSPIVEHSAFTDISKEDYFYNAVLWAASKAIVSGVSDNEFAPSDFATREQLVSILYRYAKFKGYDIGKTISLSQYIDSKSISDYAVVPMQWAVASKIISGMTENTLSPRELVDRAQLSAVLHRFCLQNVEETKDIDEVKKDDKSNSNSDIHSLGGGMISHSHVDDDNTNVDIDNVEIVPSPIITVNDVESKQGDEIVVSAEISNNPGILGMTLSVYFDDDLELVSVENGSAFKDILDLTTSKVLETGINLVWDGVEIEPGDIKDGDVVLLTFKVSQNATIGKHQVTLKCFDGDVVNNNLEGVALQIANGSIIVNK